MSHPLDLRRLRHLQAVVSARTISGAASRLGLSQPALTASLKSLEADLGVELLVRHRLGVDPTPYAELLIGHAETVDSELERAWARVTRMLGREQASLHIGCGPSEATRLLPRALEDLRMHHPGLRVIVEYGLNESLMPLVRSGEIACALSSIPRSVSLPDLQHEPLHLDCAVVVSRVGHPLANRRTLGPKDLVAYPWVLARQWELERKALDELFAQAGVPKIEPTVETTSAMLMKTMLMEGDYLSFVPREMIHWEAEAGQLRPLRGFRSTWDRQVGLTTRRDVVPPEPARWLLDSLRVVARGFDAPG
ncbi:MAG: LysR family transcriptional regulator [Burkholderiaceae bacterium]